MAVGFVKVEKWSQELGHLYGIEILYRRPVLPLHQRYRPVNEPLHLIIEFVIFGPDVIEPSKMVLGRVEVLLEDLYLSDVIERFGCDFLCRIGMNCLFKGENGFRKLILK